MGVNFRKSLILLTDKHASLRMHSQRPQNGKSGLILEMVIQFHHLQYPDKIISWWKMAQELHDSSEGIIRLKFVDPSQGLIILLLYIEDQNDLVEPIIKIKIYSMLKVGFFITVKNWKVDFNCKPIKP